MSLSLRERKVVVREVSKRYKEVRKKEKGKILDKLIYRAHRVQQMLCFISIENL